MGMSSRWERLGVRAGKQQVFCLRIDPVKLAPRLSAAAIDAKIPATDRPSQEEPATGAA